MFRKLKLEWIWLKLSYPFRFAHHPLCDRYKDQRFQIGGIHLCQGCTLVTMGILFALGMAIVGIVIVAIPYEFFILFNIVSILPAIIADGLRMGRSAKRLARFALGLAAGSTIGMILVVPQWWIKFVLIGIGTTGIITYRQFRSFTPKEDLCQTCPHLEEAPYCPGYIMQMEHNKEYKALALPLLQPDLEKRMKALESSYAEKPPELM